MIAFDRRRRRWARPLSALLLAAWLTACAVKPRPAPDVSAPALTPAAFSALPGWQDDTLDDALPALRLQCQRLALLPADTALGGTGLSADYGGRAGQWADACAAALALGAGSDTRAFVEHWFAAYRIGTPALVTGYYEPVIAGSRTRTGQFGVPVLGRPDDLAPDGGIDAAGRPSLGRRAGDRIVPYWTRAEIEAGDMGGAEKPIAYVADPIDLFFAQLQGSALLQLPQGGLLHLVFDGRNGRPYTPIGRVLIDQHQLAQDQVSMQTIRAWLEAHRDQAKAVMDHNESYIFFREVQDADPSLGPPGALGVDLTAGRSAAVDKRFVPLGALLFVDSALPDGRSWQHLVLAQDLGSAIEGPARVDVFLGSGKPAGEWAGRMRQQGAVWLLLPRRR